MAVSAYYDIGDVYVASVQVKDTNGALADATSVVLTCTLPDLSTSTPTITHPSTGNYNAPVPVTQYGTYLLSWVATGLNASAYTDSFVARAWESLVSLTDAKAYLNITSTTDDEEIRYTCVVASKMVEQYTQQSFMRQTITRTYSGSEHSQTIVLPQGTTAVTTVVESGTTLTAETDYHFDPLTGVLWRWGTLYYPTVPWYVGYDNVVVTMVVGNTTPPVDIRHATLKLIRHIWQDQRGGMVGVRGQAITAGDDYGVFPNDAIPRDIRLILDAYVPAGFA